jgi:hypothetical protein
MKTQFGILAFSFGTLLAACGSTDGGSLVNSGSTPQATRSAEPAPRSKPPADAGAPDPKYRDDDPECHGDEYCDDDGHHGDYDDDDYASHDDDYPADGGKAECDKSGYGHGDCPEDHEDYEDRSGSNSGRH